MGNSDTIFVADTCVGGLSVIKSLWNSTNAKDAVFLADYAINPLGVKNDAAIADVAGKWLKLAAEHSDTLVIACNTLSIRYHQLLESAPLRPGLRHIVSMVDCFAAMAKAEAERLADRKVLIIGTAFTACQNVYPEIVRTVAPGAQVNCIAATELERAIARFESWESSDSAVLTDGLRRAVAGTEVAVLACTCFALIRRELEALFPEVVFLDPGAYSVGLLNGNAANRVMDLQVAVTGNVVEPARVRAFAESYLGNTCSVS